MPRGGVSRADNRTEILSPTNKQYKGRKRALRAFQIEPAALFQERWRAFHVVPSALRAFQVRWGAFQVVSDSRKLAVAKVMLFDPQYVDTMCRSM